MVSVRKRGEKKFEKLTTAPQLNRRGQVISASTEPTEELAAVNLSRRKRFGSDSVTDFTREQLDEIRSEGATNKPETETPKPTTELPETLTPTLDGNDAFKEDRTKLQQAGDKFEESFKEKFPGGEALPGEDANAIEKLIDPNNPTTAGILSGAATGAGAAAVLRSVSQATILARASLTIAERESARILLKMGTHIPSTTKFLTKISGKAGELDKRFRIARDSSGNLIPQTKLFAVEFRRFARVENNVKNYNLKLNFLRKLASKSTNPSAILGIIGSVLFTSLFWAPNEKGDALTTYTIAQKTALDGGDIEMVQEIDALIQETLEISASVPLVGFVKSEIAKFKSGATSSKVNLRAAEELARDKLGIGQFDSKFEIGAKNRRI